MTSPSFGPLVLVANARLPSQRAQSLQVVQTSAAFARMAPRVAVELWHARRHPTPSLPPGVDLFDYYGAAPGPRPRVRALPCFDWIDRVPTSLQFVPARLQEWTFSREAARAAASSGGVVYSRELEAARYLARRMGPARNFRGRVYWEVHRVPEGNVRRRWLAETLPALDGLIAISGGVAEDLRALGVPPERLVVEHDGFEAARFAALPSRAEARRRLGIHADQPLVVYTGSLLTWKGVDLLVDAMASLPHAQLLVAGGPDGEAKQLERRAAGLANVRIDGFVEPTRVAEYLAAADVGVVPNRSQPAISARYTSPLKVFEAMAAGLPLVASDLPSLRELLRHGEDAWLVAPDDSAALAAGLRRLLDDGDLRRALSQKGLARSVEHTWDARAQRLLRWMGLVPEEGRP
ncbi:MAG: glycosyltransferase [Planctomycetaceae bacterium]|nr:glycosyltransferase [Planctomycetaceae bacterium]